MSKHSVRRWRKTSVLRHPLTLGHVDNLIKSNKTLSVTQTHAILPQTKQKTESSSHPNPRRSKTENRKLQSPKPTPEPDRRSLIAGA
ncbi:hypothetical protein ACB092_06G278900 [Castanea dentata]